MFIRSRSIFQTYLTPQQVKEFYINAAKVERKGEGQKSNGNHDQTGSGRPYPAVNYHSLHASSKR